MNHQPHNYQQGNLVPVPYQRKVARLLSYAEATHKLLATDKKLFLAFHSLSSSRVTMSIANVTTTITIDAEVNETTSIGDTIMINNASAVDVNDTTVTSTHDIHE